MQQEEREECKKKWDKGTKGDKAERGNNPRGWREGEETRKGNAARLSRA